MTSEIQEIDPEHEPEYVGAHSALVSERCSQWVGDTHQEIEKCGSPATHTIIMFSGTKIAQIASCDTHGEPQDVSRGERVWSGELVPKPE